MPAFTDWQAEYVKLHVEHHQLQETYKQALGALQAVEWITEYGSGGQYCPWCKGYYPGHAPGCARQAALAKAEPTDAACASTPQAG